jgi:hypothetical protein
VNVLIGLVMLWSLSVIWIVSRHVARVQRIRELEAVLGLIGRQATAAKLDHEYRDVLSYCGKLARDVLQNSTPSR